MLSGLPRQFFLFFSTYIHTYNTIHTYMRQMRKVQRHRSADETVELTTVVLQKTNNHRSSSDIKLLQFRIPYLFSLNSPWSDRPTKLHPLLIGNSFPKHPRGSRKLGAQVKKSNYQKSLRLPASTSSPLLVSLIYIFDINFCSTKKQQQQQEENGGKKHGKGGKIKIAKSFNCENAF